MSKSLLVLLGPTAVGKTSLAIELAEFLQTEIISADSRQFFREMNIGTAKPTPFDLERVKHHFINSHSISEDYNSGKFGMEALDLLEKLFQTHDTIILTGGSGLYINALCKGMDNLPYANPDIRKMLNEKLENEGLASLQKQLLELDPEYYSEADIKNPQRVSRALEVCIVSGQKYSSLRSNEIKSRSFNVIKIGLDMDRNKLYDRINNRVDQMIKEGLLEEVKSLLPFKFQNALQTVGYSELFEYLEGEISFEQAIDKIKQNTRRYAKRQLTWFRKDPETQWFQPGQKEEIINYIQEKLR